MPRFALFILVVFWVQGLLSQAQVGTSATVAKQPASSEDSGEALGVHDRNTMEVVKRYEDMITFRIGELEKLHSKLAKLDKKMEKKITIPSEINLDKHEGGHVYSVERYAEYSFDGDKVKDVRIIFKKKNIKNEAIFENKDLVFVPGQFQGIQVSTDKIETKSRNTKEMEYYREFTADAKLKTLKVIEGTVTNSVNKLTGFIRTTLTDREKKSIKAVDGL